MTPLIVLCKWWEQLNRPFHVLSQCSHAKLPVSPLFLSFMASRSVAFQHSSWQDLARSRKLVLVGDTAVELVGDLGAGGFILPSTEVDVQLTEEP